MLVVASLLAFALSGCTDSGDDGPSDPIPPADNTPNTPSNPEPPAAPPEEEDPEPIEITGTVSGLADCTILGQGQAPLQGGSEPIPAEASARSYTISLVPAEGDPVPVAIPVVLCITIDGAAASNSGTIPEGASAMQIYADFAPQGAGYVLLIE